MLKSTVESHTLFENLNYPGVAAEAFLIEKQAPGLSPNTLRIYKNNLRAFLAYCDGQAAKRLQDVTPNLIRRYLLAFAEKHNAGGVHQAYRVLKTFLFWWEEETEPEGWKNPIRKVKAPKVPQLPVEGVSLKTVMQLVKTCKRGTFTGDRDTALLLALFDTGARAREFLSVDLGDVNQVQGDMLIRSGKGRKPRTVYLGKQSRRAIRRYLKHRQDTHSGLWVTHPRYGTSRLAYDGLRSIITRRSAQAGKKAPAIHDFRRGFTLSMLPAGVDLYTLARLMGDEGIEVLKRYLKLTDQDTKKAHRRASSVDNL